MTTKIFPRTVSRLAAIQATFQHLLRPELSLDTIVHDFVLYRFTPKGYAVFQDEYYDLDQDFFTFITHGAAQHSQDIEAIMSDALPKGWSMDQMENTTRAIFRCAGFEIQACKSTPKGVILNEYIMAAHCFLLDKGHGFVNAVLDHAFARLRPESGASDPKELSKEPSKEPAAPDKQGTPETDTPAAFDSDVLTQDDGQKSPVAEKQDQYTDFISPTTLPADFLEALGE